MKAKVIDLKTNTHKPDRKVLYSVKEGVEILRQAAEKRKAKVAKLGFDPAIEVGEMTLDEYKEFTLPEKNSPYFTLEEGWKIFREWREEENQRVFHN